MWNNINNLTNLAIILQWLAIILIVLGAFLQSGKIFIDKRITFLRDKEQQTKEIEQKKKEESLNYQIITLESTLLNSKTEIEELKDKTAYVNPYTQPIQIGVVTVIIIIQSNEPYDTRYMDQGGYLAFKLGGDELLTLSDDECEGITISPGKARFKGVFNLDANHPNIGKKLTFLRDAEYLQIQFYPLEKDYEVMEGKAVCTFNGNARIEFNIPKQTMKNRLIFARNISPTLNEVFK